MACLARVYRTIAAMTTPESTASPRDSTALQWLAKTYHVATSAFEASTGMTTARWRLLFIIDRQESCTQKQLIAEIRVDPGSITRQLKTLEADGLIRRANDPDDNRLTRVSLTEEGRAYVQQIYDKRKVFLAQMLGGIDERDTQTLIRCLEHMARNLGDTRPLP